MLYLTNYYNYLSFLWRMLKMNTYDLTNPQKSIWLTEEFYAGTNINNVSGNIIIHEKVDFDLLEKALNIYVQKNDAIRMRLIEVNGIIRQYVKDYSPFTCPNIVLRNPKGFGKIQ